MYGGGSPTHSTALWTPAGCPTLTLLTQQSPQNIGWGVSPQDCLPSLVHFRGYSQAQDANLCFWLTGDKSEVSTTPTLGSINLAHRTQETHLLTRLQTYHKGYWRMWINSQMKKYIWRGFYQRSFCLCGVRVHRHRSMSTCSPTRMLPKPGCTAFFMAISLDKHDGLNHRPCD